MIKRYGQTVTVKSRYTSGAKDDFNRPIYSYNTQTVADVLVKPEMGQDIASDGTRLEGHKILYTLYFPKTFSADLENAQVQIGSEWYLVIGAPKPYPACPTDYNLAVYVEAHHG